MLGFEWTTAVSAAAGTIFGLVLKELLAGIVRRSQKIETNRDSDVAEIYSTIESIRDLADEFWTKSASELAERDMIVSGRLTAGLHQTNLLYTGLFTGPAKQDCDVAHLHFMDAVGGGEFGQPDRQAEPFRLATVHSTALTLKDVIRRRRRDLPRNLFS